MLAAGIGIGILVIPIMATVSEDALSAVPNALREASYGCGARKFNTVLSVVLPAAVSGIVAASIIAVSRGRSARRWSPRWRRATTARVPTTASAR